MSSKKITEEQMETVLGHFTNSLGEAEDLLELRTWDQAIEHVIYGDFSLNWIDDDERDAKTLRLAADFVINKAMEHNRGMLPETIEQYGNWDGAREYFRFMTTYVTDIVDVTEWVNKFNSREEERSA